MRKKIVAFILSSLLPLGMGAAPSVYAGGVLSFQKSNDEDTGEKPLKRARTDTEESNLETLTDPEPSEVGSPEESDDSDTQPIDYASPADSPKELEGDTVASESVNAGLPEGAKTPVLSDQDTGAEPKVELPSTPALPEPEACEFAKIPEPEVTPIAKWKELCDEVKPLVQRGSHVQEVEGPAMVVGDLHGNGAAADFYCRKFEELLASGRCRSIVFLGDYVDRGKNSLQVVECIFRLKINHPGQVCLLHGNHEDKGINQIYGFWKECMDRYGDDGDCVWNMINDVFDCLPLTAVIDRKTFCVHAGIPAADEKNLSRPCTLEEIRKISRDDLSKLEGVHSFIAGNALWNDYSPENYDFICDTARGLPNGRRFGNAAIDKFLVNNGLELIIRAHDHNHAIFDGGGMARDHHGRIVTTLGTPDYFYQFNSGAMRNNGYAPIVRGGTVVEVVELCHRP